MCHLRCPIENLLFCDMKWNSGNLTLTLFVNQNSQSKNTIAQSFTHKITNSIQMLNQTILATRFSFSARLLSYKNQVLTLEQD